MSLCSILIACSAVVFVSKQSVGSGIPQINAILAGVKLPGVLSYETYIAKVIGIIAMLTSGMSIGKLGPYVHIACCLAENLP